ncbi:hypothetical protein LVY75_33535 (plasmid) [Sinorhizobium sp. B11]
MQHKAATVLAVPAQEPTVAVGARSKFDLFFRFIAFPDSAYVVEGMRLLARDSRLIRWLACDLPFACAYRGGIVIRRDHAGPDLLDESGFRRVICSRFGLQVERRVVRSFEKPAQERLLYVSYVHHSQPSPIKNMTKTKLITVTATGAALG